MPTPRMNGAADVADPLRTTNLKDMLHLSRLEGEILWHLRAGEDQSRSWFDGLIPSLLGRVEAELILPRLKGCYLMYVELAVVAGKVSVSGYPVPAVSDDLFDDRPDDPKGLKRAAVISVIYVAAVRAGDQMTLESLHEAATAAIDARTERDAVVRSTDFAAFWTVKRLSEIALKAMAASVSEEGS